ncbi:MAG: aldo/keto reductase [Megasphaera elsdenii]|uniref:aldo/keto reductase n=1 Tax=Megasphaera elsdenii TaxID=907 RepID=UPI000AF29134|nr:aldo/keto reductase [Megasphaera elsdenii]MCI6301363.1 aldo/keto reductase [Megasphaera elsdenii]MDD7157194.1 aldo/keto reductase [Megasphaera elsdenii]MDY3269976.1 aldo/keto reductase [Megasphaera elsdenii]
MEFVTLNNGVIMPKLGFGVYQTAPAETEKAVSEALETGYRLIDTAASYRNEEGVGAAVRQSGIRREDLFITTKLWVQDHGYDAILKAFDVSMKKLGLDYLDLYLIHKPYGDYYRAWRAMERLYQEGRIRAIGVTSFWNERLADLANMNTITPAVNQIETNVWDQKWAEEGLMKELSIQQEAWAPFAEGNNDVFHTPLLRDIAAKHGKTVGQVMLRWLLQRDIVVIPKTVHKARMQENIDVFDFTLDEEDMKAIRTLDTSKSTIYDEMDPHIAMAIGKMTIHE